MRRNIVKMRQKTDAKTSTPSYGYNYGYAFAA